MELETLSNKKKRNGATFKKKPSLIKGTKLLQCQQCCNYSFADPDSRFGQTSICTPCDRGWR